MTLGDGRHEIKHIVSYKDLTELRKRLPLVAKRDENDLYGTGYRVRSLYFDNYMDKALLEKLNGVNHREKFRLRFYNDNTDFIRLEKKSKRNGLCFKESSVIIEQECKELLDGNIGILKENGNPLLLEFYTKVKSELLRPKNIVDYKREAFVFKAGNVRITLDYDIRTSASVKSFLNKELITVPFTGKAVLEVKYDNFLPEIIRGITHLSSRQSSAFSKYSTTRTIF